MDFVPVSPNVLRALQKDGGRWAARFTEKNVSIQEAPEGLQLDGPPGDVWAAKQVLSAMNLGFAPQKAFKLFNDTFFIEVLDLKLLVKNEKAIARLKGRVIGEQGSAKRTLEELSGASLAVSETEIGILGEFEDLADAKEAVLRLLEGSTHSGVFAFLEKRNRQKRLNLR